MVCCLILSCSQPFLNMFPCRGRQNDAKGTKIKTRCTLGAAAWLPPFCSSPPLEALIFIYAHIMHVNSSVVHTRRLTGFRSVCFCSKKESSVWLRCAEQHTSQGRFGKAARRLAYLGRPDVPKKRDCKRLIESEEWRNSFVLLKNSEYRSIVRVGLR